MTNHSFEQGQNPEGVPDTIHDRGSADWWSELMMLSNRFSRHALYRAGYPPTAVTWRILGHLERHGALRIGDIAELERTAQPTTSRVVRRLADQGIVETFPGPTDARSTMVKLAPPGQKLLRDIRFSIGHALESLNADLSEEELIALDRAKPVFQKLLLMELEKHNKPQPSKE